MISYSSPYRIIMIIINTFLLCCFVSCVVEPHTCVVQFLPTSRCERVMFSPLVRECHSHICLQPQPSRKVKCRHFDRSFDSIFLYIHKMQMWQTFQIPEMARLLCFPPEWDVSGDSIKRRSPRKPNAWRSCLSVFKQQWGRAGR